MAQKNLSPDKLSNPSRSYKIKLTIKGIDFSNELTSIRLSTSLATSYQIISLSVMVTPQSILINKLYGQDSIKLSILLLDHSEFERESMDFELMFLNSEFELPVSEILNTTDQTDRTNFIITTITRYPFQTMSSNVGCIFGYGQNTKWTGGKTVKQMIENMVSEFAKSATLKFDTEGLNDTVVDQCCIPPNSLNRGLKLLDTNHGIYNGVSAVTCQYDNTIQIMNLTARIKKAATIFIEHLTTEHKPADIYSKEKDNRFYYTYDNIYNNYTGNAKFGVLGSTINHVVLPSNQLSHKFSHKLSDLCANYGVNGSDKKETLYVDAEAINRTTYYIANDGDDLSETHIYSKIAKKVSDLSRLNFSIEKSLFIEHLIKVGSVVKLSTKTVNHVDVSGKYILFASDIRWIKGGEWQTTANLELIRTNKTI